MSKTIRVLSIASLLLLCGPTSGLFAEESELEVVVGCLEQGEEEGDEEGYLLLVTDDEEEIFVTGPEDLAKHLGHRVELTGAWVVEDDEEVFQVAGIKHISADCGA